MKIALKDIKPNPFRRMDHYPIDKVKVALLRRSIRDTGFWDNIVVRENGHGVELAYGHHRLEALRQEYPASHEIDIPVRPLPDESMLKIMAEENREEYGTRDATVMLETVRATVEAYAAGKITLGAVPAKGAGAGTWVRYAPSFIPERGTTKLSDNLVRAYTADTLAAFLGWKQPKGKPTQVLDDSLAALAMIEEGIAIEGDFVGLTSGGLRGKVEELRLGKREAPEERAALRLVQEVEEGVKIVARVSAEAQDMEVALEKKATVIADAALAAAGEIEDIAKRVRAAKKEGDTNAIMVQTSFLADAEKLNAAFKDQVFKTSSPLPGKIAKLEKGNAKRVSIVKVLARKITAALKKKQDVTALLATAQTAAADMTEIAESATRLDEQIATVLGEAQKSVGEAQETLAEIKKIAYQARTAMTQQAQQALAWIKELLKEDASWTKTVGKWQPVIARGNIAFSPEAWAFTAHAFKKLREQALGRAEWYNGVLGIAEHHATETKRREDANRK